MDDECLTRMFLILRCSPACSLAPLTASCLRQSREPFYSARPSGGAGVFVKAGQYKLPDIQLRAVPAVRVPSARVPTRTRPAIDLSPAQMGRGAAGRVFEPAFVALSASLPPPSRQFAARPGTPRSTARIPQRLLKGCRPRRPGAAAPPASRLKGGRGLASPASFSD